MFWEVEVRVCWIQWNPRWVEVVLGKIDMCRWYKMINWCVYMLKGSNNTRFQALGWVRNLIPRDCNKTLDSGKIPLFYTNLFVVGWVGKWPLKVTKYYRSIPQHVSYKFHVLSFSKFSRLDALKIRKSGCDIFTRESYNFWTHCLIFVRCLNDLKKL